MVLSLVTEVLSACPICAGQSLLHLLDAPDFESGSGDYGIDQCTACGIVFTNPRPIEAELGKLYAERDSTDFPSLGTGIVQRLRDASIDRYVGAMLASSAPDQSSLSALDYGCGDGVLARGLLRFAGRRQLPARITAVDFHPTPPPALSNQASIRYRTHAEFQTDTQRYSSIFLRHVLEHHPEPPRLLRRMLELLEPGGVLYIEIPDRRSVWAAVFGRNFFGYYLPRHLFHFDRVSLRQVAERVGGRGIVIGAGHTPLLGGSIGNAIGRPIRNTGGLGLATYPLQVAIDALFGRSSTLQVSMRRD